MIEEFICPVASKSKILHNRVKLFLCLTLFIGLFTFCGSCTENPLFPLKKTEQTTISGNVYMADNQSPKGTFVWMENFNLYTYLEDDGEFELKLSPAVSQGIDGGISGIFAIYFYHPNYLLDSLHIKLLNGKIAKNQKSIDNNGLIKNDIQLIKFFSHSVSVEAIDPLDEYPGKSEDDSLRVTVTLQAYSKNVTVRCRIWNKPVPGTTTNVLRRSAVYFISEEYNHLYEYLNINSFYYEYVIPLGEKLKWNDYILPFWNEGFSNSDYQIIPYIYPVQYLPQAMLYHMGKNKIEFTPEYLEFPLQLEPCILHIDGTLEE